MKIYIADINLCENGISEHDNQIPLIINKIPQIYKDAISLLGNDIFIFVILSEYALTPQAIPNCDKKQCLNKLQAVLQKYKNIILIPGSFSAYEKLGNVSNIENQKFKILRNYEENLKKTEFQEDLYFNKLYSDAKMKLSLDTASESLCLQNSAYILWNNSQGKRIKHKKSLPWYEENMLLGSTEEPANSDNYFFYAGSDPLIKKITVNNKIIAIGLIICREHKLLPSNTILADLPLFEIIISSTIKRIEKNLFGAVNIHMDSEHGLTVHVNKLHPKINDVSIIKSFLYFSDTNYKNEIPITFFYKQLIASANKKTNTFSQLVKTFFGLAKNSDTNEISLVTRNEQQSVQIAKKGSNGTNF